MVNKLSGVGKHDVVGLLALVLAWKYKLSVSSLARWIYEDFFKRVEK